MPRMLRVAVDVGGTFTDICVLDERDGSIGVAKVPSTPDPIDGVLDGVDEAGVDLYGGRALLARDDRGDERADHAALSPGGDGHDEGLPRRDRDPARHEGGPLGHLQGRRAAVHQAAGTGSR